MRHTTDNKRVSGRITAEVTVAPARPRKKRRAAHKDNQVPEWTTERWKHRVEAEARKLLKQEVRDVGALHK